MANFYAQITAVQTPANAAIRPLATLTRLTREQIKALATEDVWNTWGV